MKNVNCYILILPIGTNHRVCPITILSPKISELLALGMRIISVENSNKKLNELIVERHHDDVSYFIKVCHSSLLNNGFNSLGGIISNNWWEPKTGQQIIYLHSCNSAKILSHQNWQGIFDDWIGFSDYVWINTDKCGVVFWPLLFKKLQDEFLNSKDCENIIENIEDIFYSTFYGCIDEESDYENCKVVINRALNIITSKTRYKNN